jgi:putative peptide zinc metalloprotease protein
MSEVLFSSAWYRVAALRPRLRRHAQMHRHHYRGQLWYILQDHAAQRVYRFSPAAYGVIGLMDGQRTVADVWEVASARLGDDAPTQDEMIQLLTQLHAADVLQCDVPRRAGHGTDRDVRCHVHRRYLGGALQWQPALTL